MNKILYHIKTYTQCRFIDIPWDEKIIKGVALMFQLVLELMHNTLCPIYIWCIRGYARIWDDVCVYIKIKIEIMMMMRCMSTGKATLLTAHWRLSWLHSLHIININPYNFYTKERKYPSIFLIFFSICFITSTKGSFSNKPHINEYKNQTELNWAHIKIYQICILICSTRPSSVVSKLNPFLGVHSTEHTTWILFCFV